MPKFLIFSLAFSISLFGMERPARPSKRRSSAKEGEHFLFRRQKREEILKSIQNEPSQPKPVQVPDTPSLKAMPPIVTLISDDKEIRIEEIKRPFDCKFRGIDGCDHQFTDYHAEWWHIVHYHHLIAARDDEDVVIFNLK